MKVGRDNKIVAGKVEVFNIIQSPLSRMRAAMLQRGTIVILVYDTDVWKTDTLERNVKILKESGVSAIYHVQSLQNFEDEIVYATSLQDINDFFHTSRHGEFKSAFIAHKDIVAKLEKFILTIKKSGLALTKKNRLVNTLTKSLSILFTESKDKFLIKSFSWPPVFSFRTQCNRGVFLPLRTRCRTVFRFLPFRVFDPVIMRQNGGWLRLMLLGFPQEH